MNRCHTETTKKRRAISVHVGFRLLPVARVIFQKVQRSGSRKGVRSAEVCPRRPLFIGDFRALAAEQRIFGAVRLAEDGIQHSSGCG
jgi:hypothetical protein